MAASFSDLGVIAENGDFQARVNHAMMTAAVAVAAEGAVANHAMRLAYAVSIFNGSYNKIQAAAAILTNTTIAAEAQLAPAGFGIPDGDIQFAANSVFSALAGVG